MDKEITVIAGAVLKFNDSGRASTTAMAREIIGALEDEGFEIVEKSKSYEPQKKYSHEVETGYWYSAYEGDTRILFVYIYEIGEILYKCFGVYIDPLTLEKEWVTNQELSIKAYDGELKFQQFSEVKKVLIQEAKQRGKSYNHYDLLIGKGFVGTNDDGSIPNPTWDILFDEKGKWLI